MDIRIQNTLRSISVHTLLFFNILFPSSGCRQRRRSRLPGNREGRLCCQGDRRTCRARITLWLVDLLHHETWSKSNIKLNKILIKHNIAGAYMVHTSFGIRPCTYICMFTFVINNPHLKWKEYSNIIYLLHRCATLKCLDSTLASCAVFSEMETTSHMMTSGSPTER